MAEAALRLNHVFEAADQAARQYLENIRFLAENGSGNGREYEEESREGNAAL